MPGGKPRSEPPTASKCLRYDYHVRQQGQDSSVGPDFASRRAKNNAKVVSGESWVRRTGCSTLPASRGSWKARLSTGMAFGRALEGAPYVLLGKMRWPSLASSKNSVL
jgi:hypothetical protein